MTHDLRNILRESSPEVEMPSGHLTRFERKLSGSLHPQTTFWKFQKYAIAASIVFFLGISLTLYFSFNHFSNPDMLIASYSPELQETENYYLHQIDTRMDYISKVENLDTEIITDIEELDDSFHQVKNDLKSNPGDERLIHAVLDTYQMKIDLLDEIISRIQKAS